MPTSDLSYLTQKIVSLTDEKLSYLVSAWAENKRYLPAELSSIPGHWDNSVTPYLTEIMDCFSDSSSVREVAFMKGAQIGATTGILENVIGYTIDVSPGPVMYVSADKELTQQSIELRVDRMIESAGLAHKIQSQGAGSNDRYNRKTGSTKSKKEFHGGFLLAVGARNPGKLRSVSIKKLLLDEIDGYPHDVGKEGDPVSLAVKRTNGYENTRKILYISTPHILQSSKINLAYLAGDQRKFHVPCKVCGEFQELVFSGKGYGLFFERDENGVLISESVHYRCQFCGAQWKNDDKSWFLHRGKWVPTAQTTDIHYRSYHLNSLYSPVGMYSWEKAARDWVESQKSTDRLKTFINTVLGLPWEERGEVPKYSRIMQNRMDYMSGTLPKEVLFVTVACDVHKDRIDVEVLGWADKCVSYSLKWVTFAGPTENHTDLAWRDLELFLRAGYCGKPIALCLIDSGYSANAVYSFCSQFASGVLPVKGFLKVGTERTTFRMAPVSGFGDLKLVEAQVNFYKDRLAGWLGLSIKDGVAPWGYCYYPHDYTDDYFKQYAGEQKYEKRDSRGTIIGYEWRKVTSNADNHAWDCRVYNMVALDVLVELAREYEQMESFTIEDFFVYVQRKL